MNMQQGALARAAFDVDSTVRSIWARVLGLRPESIDPDANFFELGGDSVLIARVADEVASSFFPGRPDDTPGLAEFFSHATLRSLARRLAPPEVPMAATSAAAASEDVVVTRMAEASENSVAIVGMACRFPGATDVNTFWRNLREGVESVRTFTEQELRAAGVSESDLQHPAYVKAGVLLEGVREFDAAYFGMSPAEASLTSPEQRLLLECSEEALQDAGYGAREEGQRIGVFIGTGVSNYLLELASARSSDLECSRGMALFAANTGAATRVSYILDLTGPSVTLDTACSSSLVAVHAACQSILRGECSMALAGGATVRRFAPHGYFMEEGGIFSPDGHCRPFDEQAQGTVSSSGAGVVLLKPLREALADGDPIHAVIRGTAINNDGGAKAAYTAPSAQGQAKVIRAALEMARVDAASIHYLESHGTATPLGDVIEIDALREVFARGTDEECWPHLGALKANLGHMEAAAGIGGLIKAALVLRHGEAPPAIHFRAWGAALGNPPFRRRVGVTELASGEAPRRAGVSSFGIGGTNAFAVLEEAPRQRIEAHAVRRALAAQSPSAHGVSDDVRAKHEHLLLLSARTDSALRESGRRLAASFDAAPAEDLVDVACTLQLGRKHFSHRACVVAGSVAEARECFSALSREETTTLCPSTPEPVLFVFPDVGSGFPGVAALLDEEPLFRRAIGECAAVVKDMLGADLRRILSPSPQETTRYKEEWGLTACLAVQVSLAALWRSWGVTPAALLGKGDGEYAAACVAGLLTTEDALRLFLARRQGPEALADAIGAIAWGKAQIPLLSSRTGEIASAQELTCAEYWIAPRARVQAASAYHALELRAGAPSEMLRVLGRLWTGGAAVDWRTFNAVARAPHACRRVWLPTYPFERREYWLGADAARTAEERLDLSEWFNIPEWTESAVLPVGPAGPAVAEASAPPQACLLFGAWPALESVFRERCGMPGVKVIRVPPHYTDSTSIADFIERLAHEGTPVRYVIHCLEAFEAADVEKPPQEAGPASGLYSLLALGSAFACLAQKPERLVVITRGAQRLVSEAVSSPRRAMLAAAMQVIAREFPGIDWRTIDIAHDFAESSPAAPLTFDALVAEILGSSPDSLVAIRGARRFVRTFRRVALAARASEPALLRRGGAYLITGGMGGIGWTLAQFLGRAFQARLILVGRSAFPERSEWAAVLAAPDTAQSVRERILEIQALEAIGAQVLVLRANAASIHEMRRAVASARREFGGIAGVIHAAGIPGAGALHRTSAEVVDAVLAPKVMGTWVVHEACRQEALDFFVCCSSIATAITPAGWFAYCAANAYQDAFCEAHDGRTRTRFLAIGWDRWAGAGMAANGLEPESAGAAISLAEGPEVFRRALSHPRARWIISTRELAAVRHSTTPASSTRAGAEARTPSAATAVRASPPSIQGKLVGIWKELLGVDEVAEEADFFKLGGDSLSALDLHARVEEHFPRSPSLQKLLALPTLAAMTRLLQEMA